MKINQDYLKGLLEAFESAESVKTDIKELKQKGYSYEDDDFLFHLQLLHDQNFVQKEDGSLGFGYSRGGDGYISWSVVPLRLTAYGHEFLEAIRNNMVWDTIKKEFKDASIGTLWKVSKELLEGYTKKKLKELLVE
ncbi:MAG: DUF2513 domain-containing protein [bacterium]|nr:DUF2513 domain-containing protein [bacterium]